MGFINKLFKREGRPSTAVSKVGESLCTHLGISEEEIDGLDRAQFELKVLVYGESILLQTLEKHYTIIEDTLKHHSLSNEQLLTSDFVKNGTVPRKVRKQVRSLSENLRKNIFHVAHVIEEYDFKTVDEALQNVDFSKRDSERVDEVYGAQKQIHVSYQSIRLSVELFRQINKRLLSQIEESKTFADRQKESSLLLRNAILVYELSDAIVQFLRNFQLDGLPTLHAVHKQILEEIEINRMADEELRKKCQNDELAVSVKRQTLNSIAGREELRRIVKEHWDDFIQKLGEVESNVSMVQKQVSNLEMIRDNAKNQLGFLQIVAVTQMIKDNLEAIEGLLSIDDIPLAPITPEDLCRLLGIPDKNLSQIAA